MPEETEIFVPVKGSDVPEETEIFVPVKGSDSHAEVRSHSRSADDRPLRAHTREVTKLHYFVELRMPGKLIGERCPCDRSIR